MTQLALTLDEWNPYFVAYARSQGRTPAELAAFGAWLNEEKQ